MLRPSTPPLAVDATHGERLPLTTLLKIGAALMVVTSATLLGFLSMQVSTNVEETAQNNTLDHTLSQAPVITRELAPREPAPVDLARSSFSTIEPAAAPPVFMEPAPQPKWQMDLGRWTPLSEILPGRQRKLEIAQDDKNDIEETTTETQNASPEIVQASLFPVEPAKGAPQVASEPREASPNSSGLASIQSKMRNPFEPQFDFEESFETDTTVGSIPAKNSHLDVHAEPDIGAETVPKPASPVWAHQGKPLISIVIDDLGNKPSAVTRLMALPAKTTLAFLPYPEATPNLAAQAKAKDFEIFLHMPMQPKGAQDPGPDALAVDLSENEIAKRLRVALARVPGAVGVNNHMGSAFTSDRDGMDVVLREVGRRGLVFVDSRTTSSSIASQSAATNGAAFTTRDIFIDHDPSAKAIAKQIAQIEAIARIHGAVVAIGHPYDTTLEALERWIPRAIARGFEFAPVRDVIAYRHCANQPESDRCDPAMFVASLAANAVR